MNKSDNRIEYITLASVVSAIAVVFLHVNNCFWQFSTGRYWFTANIIESVFYFAVPIFFMISGAMLIDFNKRYGLKKYFNKRITKTVIPYIVWSFIGLAFQIYVIQTIALNDVSLTYIVNGLLAGNLVQIYWFFIPLFLAYISIPLFAAVNEEKRKEIFTYVVVLAFILNILVPFLISVFNLDINFSISLTIGSGALFYTLSGYLLHKYELSRKQIWILYLLSIAGLIMHLVGTYTLSMAAGEIIKTYKGFFNLPSTLYSIGFFVFIKYDLVKIMKFGYINKIVNFLNPYTFGIYLVHWYVIKSLIKIFNIEVTSIVFRLIGPFVVILISVSLIYLIRKIPVISKIIP